MASSTAKRTRRLSYPPQLNKRDSSTSITSECSVDSDWSDEDLEEMEKIFGDIQQRLNEVQDSDEELEEGKGSLYLARQPTPSISW